MFELEPSAEFSTWFERLAPRTAEEVACALEVIAAAGPALAQDHVTRALLWFDGSPHGDELVLGRSLKFSEELRELLHWQREACRTLESEAFRARLARLPNAEARDTLRAVERLKDKLNASRFELTRAGSTSASLRKLRDQFLEVLSRIGLEPNTSWTSLDGLCEVTVKTATPELRVLFGVHADARRILLLLGESLDRNYYGDSVRFAERRWREYCAREAPSLLGQVSR